MRLDKELTKKYNKNYYKKNKKRLLQYNKEYKKKNRKKLAEKAKAYVEKNRELVTWLLFWPAAFGMDDGKDKSQRLARIRGELEAIRTAMISKKCGS